MPTAAFRNTPLLYSNTLLHCWSQLHATLNVRGHLLVPFIVSVDLRVAACCPGMGHASLTSLSRAAFLMETGKLRQQQQHECLPTQLC